MECHEGALGDPPLRPIREVAHAIGLKDDELELYGDHKAKVSLSSLDRLRDRPEGSLVLVTAMTPTQFGEGKTTTSIGLSMALNAIGHTSVVSLREPSLGPVFGIKGGATGGGMSSVRPSADINLHFTGDKHAVTAAHNLLAAMVDAHMHNGNELRIDQTQLSYRRAIDMNDRALREIVIGLGGKSHGIPRQDGFIITAASEVMAILCLAEGVSDLKARLDRIIVGTDHSGGAVHAGDLRASGAMAVLLKDALRPNLVQTSEGTAALVHGGPFANIAHGTSSVTAARLARRLAEFTVTEAGFGADLGAEKFIHIFARDRGLEPTCAVMVATVRALKAHGGLDGEALQREDLQALQVGLANLDKHLENVRQFGLNPVVAVNRFPFDTEAELNAVLAHCAALNVPAALAEFYTKGSAGGLELAKLVADAATRPTKVHYMYSNREDVKSKIEAVATRIYGAATVEYDYKAEQSIRVINKLGLAHLPICIAKTQYSLSDDPKLKGRPKGWTLNIRDLYPSAGAGFLVVMAGDVVRMPGLGKSPAAQNMDLLADGTVTGLM
ncbi:MAG: formate--tetrahydrofolate ligase [Euryarchaeota archaeon]|nr:formate--tetrahydrofolate ligase [Euryarchaeota archaeon]